MVFVRKEDLAIHILGKAYQSRGGGGVGWELRQEVCGMLTSRPVTGSVLVSAVASCWPDTVRKALPPLSHKPSSIVLSHSQKNRLRPDRLCKVWRQSGSRVSCHHFMMKG